MRPLVLLRASSGPKVGMGHVMRCRSIAQEVVERGGAVLLVVDDEESAAALGNEPFDVVTAARRPDWTSEPARGAWLDGFVDWTPELERLAAAGTPAFLVENRGPAREHCDRLVYPALHYEPDEWDERHGDRILAGAPWIPLAREIRGLHQRPASERDVDLLVTFGGSDPLELTEKVLSELDVSRLSVVVAIGPHMAARRDAIRALVAGQPNVRVLLPGMPLGRWMTRSRFALTAVGTTLYELAYLGVPALVLANWGADQTALDWYAANGPHVPLGCAAGLSPEGLRAALARGLAELECRARSAPGETTVAGLGGGATRLADTLLAA